MANITEEHLHHMARRHHETMKKFEGLRAKVSRVGKGLFSTVEVGAGAWLGGAIEGKTGGSTVLRVPINLGLGAALIAAGHIPGLVSEEWSSHLNNLGNGFLGSYVAATGYAFGKRWRDTGKLLGGHSWTQPYGEIPPSVQGDLSAAEMADTVARMQAAAHHG